MMKTPIFSFAEEYKNSSPVRMHMPGHKGKGDSSEAYDITEIEGADSLYEASGIIKESERCAGEIFGTDAYFSAEGSSLAIRAMIYLISLHAASLGKRCKILAGRNAHKTFISSVALIGADVEWIFGDGSYLECKISADSVRRLIEKEKPTAVYLTSPDYLGNIADIFAISEVCHSTGTLLAVDNAHGAYLNFLDDNRHPISLGADICCDSAHKTLHALTGAAYLHVSHSAPKIFSENAKDAMALFGSTSPSYLILASLDKLNAALCDGYREKLSKAVGMINSLKTDLSEHGYTLIGNEPMKITISSKPYGYTGIELSSYLFSHGIVSEFSDPDYLVLMPSADTSEDDIKRVRDALLSLGKREKITDAPITITPPQKALSIREATLGMRETVQISDAIGRILAISSVGCPPAVPLIVSGEIINESIVRAFEYYGIKTCKVIK